MGYTYVLEHRPETVLARCVNNIKFAKNAMEKLCHRASMVGCIFAFEETGLLSREACDVWRHTLAICDQPPQKKRRRRAVQP